MTTVVLEHLTMAATGPTLSLVTTHEVLAEGADPVATGFARLPEALLAHSTSWRHEDSRVILTFVHVLPDGSTLGDGTLGDAWRGVPSDLETLPVACHAVRHLHFLRHTDPQIADVDGLEDFWQFAAVTADHHYPAVAGLLARLAADTRIDYVI